MASNLLWIHRIYSRSREVPSTKHLYDICLPPNLNQFVHVLQEWLVLGGGSLVKDAAEKVLPKATVLGMECLASTEKVDEQLGKLLSFWLGRGWDDEQRKSA